MALSEPEKHNAIHGFLRSRNWNLLHRTSNQAVVGTVLHPCMGYPFGLGVTVEYTLTGIGLSVTTTATNLGDRPCPYGSGHHPYLTVGAEQINPCSLQLQADSWLPTDDRGLPRGVESVDGSSYDFAQGRTIGDQNIDNTFTDLLPFPCVPPHWSR